MSQHAADLTTYVAAVPHEDHEYIFRRYPNGNPPGQIKAFVRRKGGEKRVALTALPAPHLKRTFVALTGKRPEELGLSTGAW